MTHFSDSPGASAQSSSSTFSQKLQAGLAALRQKDYSTAIAQLEACRDSADAAIQLKAQMGLVKAYARTQQIDRAIQLCQPLSQHTNPQVQDWSQQTLAELTQTRSTRPDNSITDRSAQTPTDTTRFTPFSSDSDAPDATGFVPLTEPATPTQRPLAAKPTPTPSAQSVVRSTPPATDRSPQTTTSDSGLEKTTAQAANLDAPIAQPSAIVPVSPGTLWRNAGRSQKWTSLGPVDVSSLFALEAGSIVLLFWLIRTGLQAICQSWNWSATRLSWFTPLPRLLLPMDWTGFVIGMIAVFLIGSPWLLHFLLRTYRLQSFSLTQLEQHSPQATRLLKRINSQRRQPIPRLEQLPIEAPVIFSYGNLPFTARIVLSQGLLKQLEEDEIAVLIAAELAHIRYWDFAVLSTIAVMAQIPYQIYWKVAAWGDRRTDRVLRTVAVIISSFNYGLFWLLRLPGIWLSRVRLYYSDRQATDLTGNPNGLTRALLKVAMGTAQQIQQQKQTDALLESLEVMLPVGYRNALTIGSLYNGDAALLEWDRSNPARSWLTVNNTHPPLGNRIHLLTQYAHKWRLESELTWRPMPDRILQPLQRLLLQGAPFFGIPIGFGIAMLLWAFGWLARQLRWFELAWLAGDRSILLACCLLGFSIGMFLRINPSFPDIKRSNLLTDPNLAELLIDPEKLPIDRQIVRLSGTLLGRKGLHNWLYRDLMLQTPTGLIRLHYTSRWGWLGDLFPKALRPTTWIDRPVIVTGWFRRGATPWIEVDTIQAQTSGRTLRSYHPLLSTFLASFAALWAVYAIFQGGNLNQ